MNTDSTNLSQIQSLLAGQSGAGGGGNGMSLFNTDALIKALMPLTIVATIISIIIALLYLFSIIQRIRVDRAILESRNILREMNAREKARDIPAPTPIAHAPVAVPAVTNED